MTSSNIFLSRKKAVIAAVFILTAVIAGTAGYLLRERTRRTLNEIATVTADATETRLALLSLYRFRLERANALLEALKGLPLKSEWTDIKTWRAETAEDLAALDLNQSAISNHIASVLMRAEVIQKPELSFPKNSLLNKQAEKARLAFRDFERFEQEIVRKRRSYLESFKRHQALRTRIGLSERPAELPLFPAERALLEKK